jgi:hypothetical protein
MATGSQSLGGTRPRSHLSGSLRPSMGLASPTCSMGTKKKPHLMNATNGTGPLRQVLNSAITDTDSALADFTVLSPQNDPYRLDLPDNHRAGAWFAEVLERLVPEDETVHLRGLHYRLVAAADVIRPDNGMPYINTEEGWLWLTTKAAKAGRWLGYVDFDRIVDERNAPPEIFISQGSPWNQPELLPGATVEIPALDAVLPHFYSPGFDVHQPFRIVLIGEKTSLKEVLSPIAAMVGGELLLPTGEMSDTMIAGIASRTRSSRPTIVLYFSDFDPSGRQMPISVARKLQALRDLRYPELKIEVHQVALTLEQVRRLGLPSTPLKATELRADRWRSVMHHEQTEIDALAALRPLELSRIALDAIKPFYDSTLRTRSLDASIRWNKEVQRLLDAQPDYQSAVDNISRARETLEEAAAALQAAQEEAQSAFRDIELPPTVPPDPIIEAAAPEPLFTTDDDFTIASQRMINHKALNEN